MGRAVSLLMIFILVMLMSFPLSAGATEGKIDTSLRRGETRQTLDPSQFPNPKIRRAYEVAREIPWVLDSIYCYCYCEESPAFRHKSLLSCYVDLHAAR